MYLYLLLVFTQQKYLSLSVSISGTRQEQSERLSSSCHRVQGAYHSRFGPCQSNQFSRITAYHRAFTCVHIVSVLYKWAQAEVVQEWSTSPAVALATDGWMSRATLSYYITPEWEMKVQSCKLTPFINGIQATSGRGTKGRSIRVNYFFCTEYIVQSFQTEHKWHLSYWSLYWQYASIWAP